MDPTQVVVCQDCRQYACHLCRVADYCTCRHTRHALAAARLLKIAVESAGGFDVRVTVANLGIVLRGETKEAEAVEFLLHVGQQLYEVIVKPQ